MWHILSIVYLLAVLCLIKTTSFDSTDDDNPVIFTTMDPMLFMQLNPRVDYLNENIGLGPHDLFLVRNILDGRAIPFRTLEYIYPQLCYHTALKMWYLGKTYDKYTVLKIYSVPKRRLHNFAAKITDLLKLYADSSNLIANLKFSYLPNNIKRALRPVFLESSGIFGIPMDILSTEYSNISHKFVEDVLKVLSLLTAKCRAHGSDIIMIHVCIKWIISLRFKLEAAFEVLSHAFFDSCIKMCEYRQVDTLIEDTEYNKQYFAEYLNGPSNAFVEKFVEYVRTYFKYFLTCEFNGIEPNIISKN